MPLLMKSSGENSICHKVNSSDQAYPEFVELYPNMTAVIRPMFVG